MPSSYRHHVGAHGHAPASQLPSLSLSKDAKPPPQPEEAQLLEGRLRRPGQPGIVISRCEGEALIARRMLCILRSYRRRR